MNLFQHGAFKSAAGLQLAWKIECDALTDDDWRTLAGMVAPRLSYKKAYGVPKGGEKFAQFLNLFCDEKSDVRLLVDDVLTTGKSIQDAYNRLPNEDSTRTLGIVLFSRMHNTPIWVRPIFQLGGIFL